jgi:PqqD family protein of HPr-rel-A system
MVPASSPSRLLKIWGDEAVVYDAASGDTHYLKPLTLALYRICQAHPEYTPTERIAALAVHFDMTDTPQLQELAEEAFHSLHKIGLLEFA